MKGEVVRLRARPGERPCERIVVGERFYVVPRAGEEVVVGATVEDRGFDLRVTAGGVHELLREAYRALPEIAELELIQCAAGLRPTTPDNAPMIGATAVDGLLVAGGHHRNGVLLAPITADAIGALLRGEEMPAAIAALDPGRFPSNARIHA
jgi:glycine oxidase